MQDRNYLEALHRIDEAKRMDLTKLYLYDLKLKEVPKEINNLTQLTSLILYGNQIADISFLKNLTQLTSLTLDGEQTTDFSSLKDLTQLIELRLCSNQITDFSFLKYLTQLTSLELLGNQITSVSFLKDLKQLTSLVLDYNQIVDISFLKELTQLTSLNLRDNQITSVSFLKDLKQLTSLNLRNNQITDVSFLKDLKQVTSLDLRNNQIIDVSFLKGLKQLTSLDLGHNQIIDVSFLKDLTQLTSLHLSSNQIIDVSFLKNLTQLTSLYLSGNQIVDFYFLKNLMQLTSLGLTYIQVTDFSFLKDLKQLTSLDLTINKITDLAFLKDLAQLTTLDLGSNQVTDVSFLKDLTQLTSLGLAYNQVTDVSFLKDLKQLTSLDLTHNRITDVSFLKDLKQLTSLNLRSNRITDVSFLKDLKQLTSLDLRSNRITDVSFLKDLKQLTSLDLGKNQIANISFSADSPQSFNLKINDYPNLKTLYLFFNPIKDIPKSIYDEDGKNCYVSLRSYQKDTKLSGKSLNDRIKLIFVGNGRTGKTSLMRVLRKEIFQENEISTHGIYIEEWEAVEGVNFAIWDFGGQHLYHATHRLFLQTEAMIVLCWDTENENNEEVEETNPETDENHIFKNYPLTYWLDYIKTLGKNSPIFLAQTKIEKEGHKKKATPHEETLRDRYNIIDSFHIDSKTDKGINNFRNELVEYAKKKITNEAKIPTSWYKVREDIRKLIGAEQKKRLSVQDFAALCQDNGLDNSSTCTVRDYLHTTGVFFYQEKLFGGSIILDQKWAIDAVYTLFNRTGLFYLLVSRSNGQFSAADLAYNWKDYSVDEQKVFIGFMQQCEICFDLTEKERDFNKKIWVAPSLLPEKVDPSVLAHFKKGDATVRFLRFEHNFLHYGVIQSFIIRTRHLSSSTQMWRNGIWLNSDGAMALIEADESKKQINIRVKGVEVKALLDKIRNELLRIHDVAPEAYASLDGLSYIPLSIFDENPSLPTVNYKDHLYNWKDYRDFLNVDEKMRFEEDKMRNIAPDPILKTTELQDMKTVLLKEHLTNLVLEANHKEALEILYKWTNQTDNHLNSDVVLLSSRYNGLQNQLKRGVLDQRDADRSLAQITYALNDLIEKAPKQATIQIEKKQDEAENIEKRVIDKSNGSLSHLNPEKHRGSKIKNIIFLTANPAKTTKLALREEYSAIQKVLENHRRSFDVYSDEQISPADLLKALNDPARPPSILHFSGHGKEGDKDLKAFLEENKMKGSDGGGLIVSVNDGRGFKILDNRMLDGIFKVLKQRVPTLELVILNACFSASQAEVISKHGFYVVGIHDKVPDKAASAFSDLFYDTLTKEYDFANAVDFARINALAEGLEDLDDIQLFFNGKSI